MNNELKELTSELSKVVKLAKKEVDKIVAKGDLTPGELESVYKLACIAEKLTMLEGMDGEEMAYGYGQYAMNPMGMYGNQYGDYGNGYGYSERRGRSPVTGRYISRGMSMDNGYSGHSIEDRMIASLENQMDQAKTEYERKMIMDEIQHIRQGTR